MKRITQLIIFLIFISCGQSPLYGPMKASPSANSVRELQASDELKWLDDSTHLAFQWSSIPAVGKNSSFNLKFWNSQQTNFLGPYKLLKDSLCVFLWMKMPDGSEHGSSPLEISMVHLENGSFYVIDQVYFIMPGKWQIRIRTVKNSTQCRGYKADPYLKEKIVEITVH